MAEATNGVSSPEKFRASEYVMSDPNLSAVERETSIWFHGKTDELEIYSADLTMMRRLLQNPAFRPTCYTVHETPKIRTVSADEWDGSPIVGVRGTAPIGALKIKGSPRSNNNVAGIVGKGDDPRGES
jgi:hypothetical protein